jgi:hypothetical protein
MSDGFDELMIGRFGIVPMPDSSVEEIRASVLRYIRMYEEGGITLRDLKVELGVWAELYEHSMGAVKDNYRVLLRTAADARELEDVDAALTLFRRAEAGA